jgi:hypothetical protein
MMDLEAVYARNESLQAVFGDNQQRPSGSLRNISGNVVEFAQFDGENGEDWSCPAWTLSTAAEGFGVAEELPISICRVQTPDGVKDYVTCVPHQTAFQRGLAPEAIIGLLLKPVDQISAITPEVFSSNRVFVDFLYAVIARRCPELPGMLAEARRQGDGWVYVIDQRTRNPEGHIPPEDILGVFTVQGGKLMPDSYQRCPKHMILSADGFFRLGAELQACLLEELASV